MMKSLFSFFTATSLRFRYVTIGLVAIVLIAGGVAISQLNQELLPPIEFPQTILLAQVSGMTSDQVVTVVTERLEDELATSDRYALVVALLARSFEGRGGLQRAWPSHLSSLNREETLELQTLLNGLGHDAGNPDGLFGSGTRRAVRSFQSQQGMAADGYPTHALLDAVRTRAGVAVQAPAPPQPLGTQGIRELQRLLNRLGYNAGRADGRIGPATRAAIRAFERARGLEVRGRATSTVLEAARSAAG